MKRQRSLSRPSSLLICSIIGLLQVDSFSWKAETTRIRNYETSLRFRNEQLPLAATSELTVSPPSSTTSSTVSTTTFYSPNTVADFTRNTPLPTWLSIPLAHRKEAHLKALETAMKQSMLFSDNECHKLLNVIQHAAQGDAQKMAGAAEFCLLLVETMEMSMPALIAAAFHYCSCVRAREQQRDIMQDSTIEQAEAYGNLPLLIARDAASLKRLETVASTVMHKESDRVRPSHKDAENLTHLFLMETKDWRALAIRAAACLYRLRGILQVPSTGLQDRRVAREALWIYAPLASRLGMHRLKNEIEGAAFRILYPRQYKKVSSLADDPQAMQGVLEGIQEQVQGLLEKDIEFRQNVAAFSVTARVKEPYSMWQKMLRNGYTDILQVPDALALRVVLESKQINDEPQELVYARDRALCYYVQRLCSQHLPPQSDPRFKDYIENPKANGYQSLHYTAHTGNPSYSSCEIQVRSKEMHNIAEFGLASHWDYKAMQGGSSDDEDGDISSSSAPHDHDASTDAYVRMVQQWHYEQRGGATQPKETYDAAWAPVWESRHRSDRIRARAQRLEPYLEALTATKSDLAREFVFVFLHHQQDETESGQVMALPAGSCVLDALRQASLRDETYMYLNGDATSVTRQLHNGDVLSV